MSVYSPTGSGGAHMDKSISGKKATDPKKAPAKKAAPFPPKKGAPVPPAKKAAPGKKAVPPFLQPKKK